MKDEKLFPISFGKMNRYYILPFITPIFSSARSIMIFIIRRKNKDIEFNLFFLILSSFAYVGCGLFLLILSFNSKQKK